MRDFCVAYHAKVTGYAATTEQLVPAWNRIHPRTGELEEAKLDVATRDAVTGNVIHLDASVTRAHCDDQSRQRARSGRDGIAVLNREDDIRQRSPLRGGEVARVVFETSGRPGDAAVACARPLGHDREGIGRAEVLRCARQRLSCLLQVGSAMVLLATIGAGGPAAGLTQRRR